MSPAYVDVHKALIEACKQTPKWKRFIPSEFGGNTEEFTEEPGTAYQFNMPVRDALKEQSELEWTVVVIGFVMDYIVPSTNRYHSGHGPVLRLGPEHKDHDDPGHRQRTVRDDKRP